MKKPIAIISNDWHIASKNVELKLSVVRQQLELGRELGVTNHLLLGDVFVSKIAQDLPTLLGFTAVLDMFAEHGATLWAIPGNHDKSSYSSDDSFLDVWREHSNFSLISAPASFAFGEVNLHFMPFWEDAVWLEKFKKIEPVVGEINILLSHIAINGSVNNDGSKVSDSGISASLFKSFSSVLLGHYHNQSKPASNVYHLPSLNQSSFGEDDQKGFTVLYSDGSHKLVLSRAPKYLKLEIDLATTKKAQIEKIKKEYGNSGNHIEVSLIGPEKMVSSIDKEQFESIGIRVKKKASIIQDELDDPVDEVEELPKYNSSSIKEEFTAFLDQEAVSDRELGIKLLNKKLGVC